MIRNFFGDIFDWFIDSKIGATICVFGIVALVGFGGPALVHNIEDATATGYTGTAKVISHNTYGSFCNVLVKRGDGVEEKLVYGPRLTCGSVEDGMSVNLVKGNIRHQQ